MKYEVLPTRKTYKRVIHTAHTKENMKEKKTKLIGTWQQLQISANL